MVEAGGRAQRPRALIVYLDLIPMPKRVDPGDRSAWWRDVRQECIELVSRAAGVESLEEKAAWAALAREREGVDGAIQRAVAQGRPLRFKRSFDHVRGP